MQSQNDGRGVRIVSLIRPDAQRNRNHRAGSTARRRHALGFRPVLHELELRQLLATSAIIGPTVPMSTLNLQLDSATSTTLTQLMPLITAAGATVQSTTISGLYEVQGPSREHGAARPGALGQLGRAVRRPAADASQIATVPNDPDYTNGDEWAAQRHLGHQRPRGLERHHRLGQGDRRRHRHRHRLQRSRPVRQRLDQPGRDPLQRAPQPDGRLRRRRHHVHRPEQSGQPGARQDRRHQRRRHHHRRPTCSPRRAPAAGPAARPRTATPPTPTT